MVQDFWGMKLGLGLPANTSISCLLLTNHHNDWHKERELSLSPWCTVWLASALALIGWEWSGDQSQHIGFVRQ